MHGGLLRPRSWFLSLRCSTVLSRYRLLLGSSLKKRCSHAMCTSGETMSSSTLRDSSSSSTCKVSIAAVTSVDKENSSHKQLVLALGSYICIISEDKLTHVTDGSGILGYSSLLILKALMERIAAIEDRQHYSKAEKLPLPCHYFDYIFGTSTGG